MFQKQQSLNLVATDPQNNFYIPQKAKQFLQSLDKPIAIVSIAGMYRTGKSYLVNRLVCGKINGFKIGSTTQSVTKGLNVWSQPILAKDQNNSQGIGSCEQQLKYDLRLLMLVFLISSTVIYNSMGAIDQVTLDQLRVVVNLKKTLSSQSPSQKTKLVWVLRDFALQLMDKNGKQMTPNQYLQQCLEENQSSSYQGKKKNQIRKALKQGLGKRCCYTLVRPTINEDQLANLSNCKLRNEFINKIEQIKQEVFSGGSRDIKVINGTKLNGRLLLGLLQQCISNINADSLPDIGNIWQSVRDSIYDEQFQKIGEELKKQILKMSVSLNKDEIRLKLSEIQNKYTLIIEQKFIQIQAYKKYHKLLTILIQKYYKQIRKNNALIIKQKTLKQIRQFVKQNINYQNIEPTNITLFKTFIQRLELKTKGQIQAYQYVLGVLYDLLHIIQQKAIFINNQLNQYKKVAEIGCLQKRNNDLILISLKRDYHQSLKTINNLKITQQQIQKQNIVLKSQYEALQISMKTVRQSYQLKQTSLLRQLQQLNLKMKQRSQQSNNNIKKLKLQIVDYENEIQLLKQQKIKGTLSERKEIIFQQKMKQTWQKFDQQRKNNRIQITHLKKQINDWRKLYQQQKKNRQIQNEKYNKEKQIFLMKQKSFTQQIKQIKNIHAQTKKTYSTTFNVMKDSDRIFRNVENVMFSNQKLASNKINQNKEELNKKDQMQELKSQAIQIQNLKKQINKLQNLNSSQSKKCQQQMAYIQHLEKQKQKLQQQTQTINSKFIDTVNQIQQAKQRQRSLYEQSILRLLSNLQKRDMNYMSTRRQK